MGLEPTGGTGAEEVLGVIQTEVGGEPEQWPYAYEEAANSAGGRYGTPVWTGRVLWAVDTQVDGEPWPGTVSEDFLKELGFPLSSPIVSFVFIFFFSLFSAFPDLDAIFIGIRSLQPQCFPFFPSVIESESGR